MRWDLWSIGLDLQFPSLSRSSKVDYSKPPMWPPAGPFSSRGQESPYKPWRQETRCIDSQLTFLQPMEAVFCTFGGQLEYHPSFVRQLGSSIYRTDHRGCLNCILLSSQETLQHIAVLLRWRGRPTWKNHRWKAKSSQKFLAHLENSVVERSISNLDINRNRAATFGDEKGLESIKLSFCLALSMTGARERTLDTLRVGSEMSKRWITTTEFI